jgi:hypothetical protein
MEVDKTMFQDIEGDGHRTELLAIYSLIDASIYASEASDPKRT